MPEPPRLIPSVPIHRGRSLLQYNEINNADSYSEPSLLDVDSLILPFRKKNGYHSDMFDRVPRNNMIKFNKGPAIYKEKLLMKRIKKLKKFGNMKGNIGNEVDCGTPFNKTELDR